MHFHFIGDDGTGMSDLQRDSGVF